MILPIDLVGSGRSTVSKGTSAGTLLMGDIENPGSFTSVCCQSPGFLSKEVLFK